MGARLTLTGGRALQSRLRRLAARADPVCEDILRQWSGDVAAAAVTRAPRDTGEMAGAITARFRGLICEVGVFGGTDTSAGYYARWVELGNSRTPAQPFLGPAARAHRRDLARYARRALARATS